MRKTPKGESNFAAAAENIDIKEFLYIAIPTPYISQSLQIFPGFKWRSVCSTENSVYVQKH